MSNDKQTGESNTNIWAPWRMEYISGLSEPENGCFLCAVRDADCSEDRKNLLLWRGKTCMCVLNRFPYTGGHGLIAPYDHVGELADTPTETMTELMEMLRDFQGVTQHAINPHGFNVGINLGRCAGAGLPGHLHIHNVPRWDGDTNFISVLGDVRVIPEFLEKTYDRFRAATDELGLSKRYGAE
ncbi:MAG: HIT domain-containing protein [Phycisphaerae bacterium]|nr:HIT domain-containing protein [Phycisphaerae bacterium]